MLRMYPKRETVVEQKHPNDLALLAAMLSSLYVLSSRGLEKTHASLSFVRQSVYVLGFGIGIVVLSPEKHHYNDEVK